MGGSLLGGAVASFLDGLVPDILNGFLVWPQRIVVPILGEDVTGPLDDLQARGLGWQLERGERVVARPRGVTRRACEAASAQGRG